MINKIKEYSKKNSFFDKCGHVVIGLSGGADSVCLLVTLNEMKKEFGYEITAVHVHHGIRGEEADRDLIFCRDLCDAYKISLREYFFDVPSICMETGESMEEAGRRLRYETFNKVADEFYNSKIAVAHHMNDKAETVLFNLTRGTGVKGLHGIIPSRNGIIRPLLCLERKEIVEYLTNKQINFCQDSTNFSNDYSRNKLRNVIIPGLEEINPAAVKNINSLADKIYELENYLDYTIEIKFQESISIMQNGILLKIAEDEYPYIAKQLIIRTISKVCGKLKDVTDAHINMIYDLISKNSGSSVDIKYGISVKKETEGLFFCNKKECDRIVIDVENNSTIALNDKNKLSFRNILWNNKEKITNQVYTKYFDYDKIKLGLQIRTRKEGDYLVIDDMGHKKSLNRYFIDEKIPVRLKDNMLLLTDGSHVLWVIGMRISEYYKITSNTKRALVVEYEGEDYA